MIIKQKLKTLIHSVMLMKTIMSMSLDGNYMPNKCFTPIRLRILHQHHQHQHH